MRHSIVLLSALPIFAAGCYTVDIAGQSNFNGCVASPVITAGQGISDFRQRIARQVAVAAADSILDVVITFSSDVVQADRDRIVSYGGTNIVNGATSSSLEAELVAQSLELYVSQDTTMRLSDVTILDPACITD